MACWISSAGNNVPNNSGESCPKTVCPSTTPARNEAEHDHRLNHEDEDVVLGQRRDDTGRCRRSHLADVVVDAS
jgi:hypothetical protein